MQTDQEKGNTLLRILTPYVITRDPYEAEMYYKIAMDFYKNADVKPPFEAINIKNQIDKEKEKKYIEKIINKLYEFSINLEAIL